MGSHWNLAIKATARIGMLLATGRAEIIVLDCISQRSLWLNRCWAPLPSYDVCPHIPQASWYRCLNSLESGNMILVLDKFQNRIGLINLPEILGIYADLTPKESRDVDDALDYFEEFYHKKDIPRFPRIRRERLRNARL